MSDLLSVQRLHRELYTLFMEDRAALLDNIEEQRNRIEQLLEAIKTLAGNVTSIDDYLWLSETLEKWRAAGEILGIPVNLVLAPPAPGQPLKLPNEPMLWSDSGLEKWVESKAFGICKGRALRWHSQLSSQEILRRYLQALPPDVAGAQKKSDWHQAEVYLACDVLDGRMDLVTQLTPDSYWRLEGRKGQMWLDEVKKLKAYVGWRARGDGWGASSAREDYFHACDQIRQSLLDPTRKAPQAAFDPIQKYLETRFLNRNQKFDRTKPVADLWVKVKAERLQETGSIADYKSRELQAEKFVTMFYENLAPAILGPDLASLREVVKALGSPKSPDRFEPIVNCFEMAVAIYFLDAAKTREALEEQSTEPLKAAAVTV